MGLLQVDDESSIEKAVKEKREAIDPDEGFGADRKAVKEKQEPVYGRGNTRKASGNLI